MKPGTQPRFEITDYKGRKPKRGTPKDDLRVWLHCSSCNARIREMQPNESIRVDRAWFCEKCEPGIEVPNPL